MQALSYRNASVPVRENFAAAHTRCWQRLAAPGAWWTGAQRVALAAEVRQARHCALCQARRAALTPAAVQGDHDHLINALPLAAVDVVHRVVADPSRLTPKWFKSVMDAGLSAQAYVEIIGTVVAIVSIDSFCRGIGVPLHPLPEPQPGEPSHYRPQGATQNDAWVPMIPPENVGEAEADLYGGNPAVGNVIRAMSLVPDEVRTLQDLSTVHYLPSNQVRDPGASAGSLSRIQMELVAGRVSALRECFY